MRERCGRCGRFLVTVEYVMGETSEVDSFEHCTNPTCIAADDADLAEWYSRIPDDAFSSPISQDVPPAVSEANDA